MPRILWFETAHAISLPFWTTGRFNMWGHPILQYVSHSFLPWFAAWILHIEDKWAGFFRCISSGDLMWQNLKAAKKEITIDQRRPDCRSWMSWQIWPKQGALSFAFLSEEFLYDSILFYWHSSIFYNILYMTMVAAVFEESFATWLSLLLYSMFPFLGTLHQPSSEIFALIDQVICRSPISDSTYFNKLSLPRTSCWSMLKPIIAAHCVAASCLWSLGSQQLPLDPTGQLRPLWRSLPMGRWQGSDGQPLHQGREKIDYYGIDPTH